MCRAKGELRWECTCQGDATSRVGMTETARSMFNPQYALDAFARDLAFRFLDRGSMAPWLHSFGHTSLSFALEDLGHPVSIFGAEQAWPADGKMSAHVDQAQRLGTPGRPGSRRNRQPGVSCNEITTYLFEWRQSEKAVAMENHRSTRPFNSMQARDSVCGNRALAVVRISGQLRHRLNMSSENFAWANRFS